MHNFYFTFGDNENFPFQNGYIIIQAKNLKQALELFKLLYPYPNSNYFLRCSDFYTEGQWSQAIENHSYKCFGIWTLSFKDMTTPKGDYYI